MNYDLFNLPRLSSDALHIIEKHDTNVHDSHGDTPLHFLMEIKSEKVALALLEKTESADIRGEHGRIPLHYIAGISNEKVALALIAKTKNACTKSTIDGQVPLHSVWDISSEKVALALIERYTNVNCKDKHGVIPLDLVCSGKAVPLEKVVTALLDKTKSINLRVQKFLFHSMLKRSSRFDNIMLAIIDKIDVSEIVSGTYKQTILHYLASFSTRVKLALLEKAKDVCPLDVRGRTPYDVYTEQLFLRDLHGKHLYSEAAFDDVVKAFARKYTCDPKPNDIHLIKHYRFIDRLPAISEHGNNAAQKKAITLIYNKRKNMENKILSMDTIEQCKKYVTSKEFKDTGMSLSDLAIRHIKAIAPLREIASRLPDDIVKHVLVPMRR